MRTITVVPYNPKWENEFERIKDELMSIVSDIVISVEHVGSTSVPGLHAKPIIDIDIVIDCEKFVEVKGRLAKIGYFHIGNLGVEGREAFEYKERLIDGIYSPACQYQDKSHLMDHHLYVCDKNSDEVKRHLALRDFLRTDNEYRKKYADIKLEMANKYPHDIDSYILGKEPIILEIYEKCGLDTSYKTSNVYAVPNKHL